MSTAILTSTNFVGMDIAITREPKWETRVQENLAGKETRVSYRITPRWTWTVDFNFLRNSTNFGTASGSAGINYAGIGGSSEFASFMGFYNQRSGGFDSWQWEDPEDNTLTAGTVVGTGSSLIQLARSLGGLSENILAPSSAWSATVDSSAVAITTNFWGSSIPGQIQFSTLSPTSTMAVLVTGSYYWPVRFDKDTLQFQRMMTQLWELKKVSFTSIL